MEMLFGNFKIYKNKNILVTGHTGFKGSWLTQWLIKLGANVTGYSLYPYINSKHFDELQFGDKIKNNFVDIRDKEKIAKVIDWCKPDLIFHLAAMPIVLNSYNIPAYTYDVNIQGTVNLIESSLCSTAKGMVCVTTDKVYENAEDIYAKRETDNLGANDPYSTSKACVELIVESFKKINSHFLISTCRGGNTIGGGDYSEYRIIPDYIKAIQDNKEFLLRFPYATRPYIHVLDVLNGYLTVGSKILDTDISANTSFNFGPDIDSEVDNEELLKLMKKYYPYKNIKINHPSMSSFEKNYLSLDSTKARKILKWKPKYNIKQSVQKTMEWYKEYIENGNIITEKQIEEYGE
jgi:CDP-glucose 4,6-dehydratase